MFLKKFARIFKKDPKAKDKNKVKSKHKLRININPIKIIERCSRIETDSDIQKVVFNSSN